MLAIAAGLSASAASAAVPTHKVRMYMNVGFVEIELYHNESPLNVDNYLTHADAGDYDGSFIHRTRAFNPSQPFGYDLFVQGGSFKVPIPPNTNLSSNPVPAGPTVVNEFNAANGLTNKPGSLAAARSTDPDSARSGWFINQSNNSNSFDAGPYTVYGQVTAGMNLIDAIPFQENDPDLAGTAFESMPLINNLSTFIVVRRIRRIPVLAGDYDFSGAVTAADYNLWRSKYRSLTDAAPDGNGNGIVDAADYTIWRNHFGTPPAAGSGENSLAAPEPASLLLSLIAASLLALRRRPR
jgi:cyclophilin family peptidyl-prolyl cis-trans isomerase